MDAPGIEDTDAGPAEAAGSTPTIDVSPGIEATNVGSNTNTIPALSFDGRVCLTRIGTGFATGCGRSIMSR